MGKKSRRKAASVVAAGSRPIIALRPMDAIKEAERLAAEYEKRGEVEKAIDTLSELVLNHPKRMETYRQLARILIKADRMPEAAQVFAVLSAYLPADPQIRSAYGTSLARMGMFPEAIEQLKESLRIDPKNKDAWILLAQVYEQSGADEEAVPAVARAVELDPENLELATYAAGLLHHSGRERETHELLVGPSSKIASRPEARLLDALLMPVIMRSVDEIRERRSHLATTLDRLNQGDVAISSPDKTVLATNFLLGYHGLEDRDLIEATAKTRLKLTPSLGYVSPVLDRKPVGRRRLKVGFLSANMRKHSVGRVLNRFMKELDREQFEVTLFELPGKFEGGQELGRDLADKTVLVPSHLKPARSVIEAEQPDILVIPDFVLEPFSDYLAYSRLAPVQCSTWGHPGTSGRPSLDYWVSCEDWEPAGNERLYTERLIRFKKPPMIATPEPRPDPIASREELGLPEGRLYGCPQSLYKLHPEFDGLMAEVIERDPDGWLVVVGGIQKNWMQTYKDRVAKVSPGAAERLVIMPHLKTSSYMSLLHHCEVSLDPIHFGGANTSMEAFWMGVPVVTLPGGQLRNRQTLSFYRMMDFEELIVDTTEAYVDLALKIAHDREYRDYLSREILSRVDVIFDTVDVTREWEAFFQNAAQEAIGK